MIQTKISKLQNSLHFKVKAFSCKVERRSIYLAMSAKTLKKPVIGVLTGAFVSDGAADFATSPRTQSPRGLKSFDSGGVGLGIVAALEKSAGGRSDIPALFCRNFSRSSPIPVKNSSKNRRDSEEMEVESLEEYTIVTCHGPNKSYTKVYSDAAEVGRKGDDRTPFRIQTQSSSRATVFHISPPRFGDATGSPPSDFLSACDLCRKKLHGKDIYMYR